MGELHDILSLTEAQVVALREQLSQVDVFHGVHLYVRKSDPDNLVIGSDGWPGEVRIERSGRVEVDE